MIPTRLESRPSTRWSSAAGRPAPRRPRIWPAAAASVLLLDRAGRIKPCGGAIPPRLIRDFDIPDDLLVARVTSAQDGRAVRRARSTCRSRTALSAWSTATCSTNGCASAPPARAPSAAPAPSTSLERDRCRQADRPLSPAARRRRRRRPSRVRAARRDRRRRRHLGRRPAGDPGGERMPFVFAYHEIVRSPSRATKPTSIGARCDVYYQGAISPDFYGWVFPHGDTASVGTGSARQGLLPARRGRARLREAAGLGERRDDPPRRRADPAEAAASAGTMAATSCSPAMPRASSRRPPAKASTTP